MTIVPDSQPARGFGLSGKSVANLQVEVAELENKKEALVKECNFLDSFRREVGDEIYKLDKEKVISLGKEASEYVKIIEYIGVLRDQVTNEEDHLVKLKNEKPKLDKEVNQLKSEFDSLDNRYQSKIKKNKEELASLEKKRSQISKENHKVEIATAKALDQKEKALEEANKANAKIKIATDNIQAERQLLIKKNRDLAIKHRRLQEFAKKHNIKGV